MLHRQQVEIIRHNPGLTDAEVIKAHKNDNQANDIFYGIRKIDDVCIH